MTPFFQFDATRLVYSNGGVAGTTIGSVANVTTTSVVGNLAYNSPISIRQLRHGLCLPRFSVLWRIAFPDGAEHIAVHRCFGDGWSGVHDFHAATTGIYNPTLPTTNTVTGLSASTPMILSNGSGFFSPYFADSNNNGVIDASETFAKPQSFQIISAGQDGSFGTTVLPTASPPKSTYFRLFPTAVGYDSSGADDDNITSFNERNSLDAAKP